ncbi:ExbD/TolR family protein [Maribacter sp. MAR_2009_72]|uniref:ExbD/TolR family protein n=1 Tax=Maribacter sp. MAR_2009_72 TaxID=1250050 RepID=UPI001198F23B|nr:biopolymer transporter ExbD [Maribacter sp. MAR_2009_72]TVZ16629.1 biopolymer transport protein ExbD/TolR [Maribacter sp. MAR_2009_72]
MKNHRLPQEVNAGSMADIAFLLLIFFLVTTTIENDEGLNRLMPPENEDIIDIKQRNIFIIVINDNDQILAEDDIIDLENLKGQVISFIDNGGLSADHDEFCTYCKGDRLEDSSENPSKAIISIKSSRKTSYPVYVAVQNEVVAAYNHLRNRESLRMFGISFEAIHREYFSEETKNDKKETLKDRLEIIRELFPQKILEPESINN